MLTKGVIVFIIDQNIDQKDFIDKVEKKFGTKNKSEIYNKLLKSGIAQETGEFEIFFVKNMQPNMNKLIKEFMKFGVCIKPKIKVDTSKL